MKPLHSSSPSSHVTLNGRSGVGPAPDDENIAAALVDLGRRVADRELRDAVTERYVDEANAGEETDRALEEIARAEAATDLTEEIGPENDGVYGEVPPEN